MANNVVNIQNMFEVILGTYEEYLLGYKFSPTVSKYLYIYLVSLKNVLQECKATQSFASHDHSSSIRCVDISDNYVASGGADDRIFVYDLKTRQEHCMLTHNNGTVNCLRFTNNHSHLLSGTADGNITVVRVGNWQVEKVWEKAHKGAAILDIAVHMSGKLALSLGADCTLHTWNLIKGRQAFVINLNSKSSDARSLDRINWAPCGTRFILSGGKYTEIWSIETGGILSSVRHTSKVVDCLWISDNTFIVGYENGQLGRVNSESGKIKTFEAHSTRVKSLKKFEEWIVSACSNGEFKVWDSSLNELFKLNTGCRLTCLCIAPLAGVKKEEQTEIVLETSESENKTVEKRKHSEVVIEDDDELIMEEQMSKSSAKNKRKKRNKIAQEATIQSQTENVETESSYKKNKISHIQKKRQKNIA